MIPSDDPAHDWDVYCAEQEDTYAAFIDGKTCRDCARCKEPPDGRSEWGWCDYYDDWVLLFELVTDTECEAFE